MIIYFIRLLQWTVSRTELKIELLCKEVIFELTIWNDNFCESFKSQLYLPYNTLEIYLYYLARIFILPINLVNKIWILCKKCIFSIYYLTVFYLHDTTNMFNTFTVWITIVIFYFLYLKDFLRTPISTKVITDKQTENEIISMMIIG